MSESHWNFQPAFRLPDSPDSPEYKEVMDEIEHGDVEESAIDFRVWCENDFWFFTRHCLTIGDLVCQDPHSDWYGKRWMDHPWLFDRCRDLQFDDFKVPKMRKWPRFFFKTALVTQSHTVWDHIIHSDEYGTHIRTLILTYKVDEVGESFMYIPKRECEMNDKLKFHWPHVFWSDPIKESPGWTIHAVWLKTKGIPKEPTILIHGLNRMPTSGHYDRIKIDDAVVRETVTTKEQIEKIYQALKQTAPLRADNTLYFYVGTNWRAGDPWQLAERDGMFEVDHQDCYDEDGQPVLRSARWLEDLKKDFGPYNFAAQMRGNPAAESRNTFDVSWLNYYDTNPRIEARNKNVYIFIDPARSTKPGSDYTAIVVIGLGGDRNLYILDMYRDRYDTREFKDLIFDLHAIWKPKTVFEEITGADRDIGHFKDEMEDRNYRFHMREIPVDRLKKEERIRGLQQEMSKGKFYFPRVVGHTPKGDNRDVMQVFREEEYQVWTPEAGSLHDDLLDCLAWPTRPKVARMLMWPRAEESLKDDIYRRRERIRGRTGAGHSAWVA